LAKAIFSTLLKQNEAKRARILDLMPKISFNLGYVTNPCILQSTNLRQSEELTKKKHEYQRKFLNKTFQIKITESL
jgi:hypothetical protein